MKRTIKSLLLAAWIIFAAACSKDSSDTEGPNDPQGPDDPQTELCTVTVRLNGIDQSIEPISKATTTLPDTLRLRVTMNVFDQNGSIACKEEKLLTEIGTEIPVQFQPQKNHNQTKPLQRCFLARPKKCRNQFGSEHNIRNNAQKSHLDAYNQKYRRSTRECRFCYLYNLENRHRTESALRRSSIFSNFDNVHNLS